MAASQQTKNGHWTKSDVKIIPSLVVGLGGTGIGAMRHLKRRVRLDWPGIGSDAMPELVQFYGIDSVSYRNGGDLEFIRPSEYGFSGGFDPQRLLREHRAIREWWDFRPGMLPPGVIHLGARQIRALGRMSLFHALPGIWENLSFKIDRLNSITAGMQANRYGFEIPVETSARQVVIVSSICGGTGAGAFIDLAARIRQYSGTAVRIVAVLVLPSAFTDVLPSDRQRNQVKANAYAALKEINAFWFADDEQRFEVRYPGEAQPHRLKHALFNEIYLIGRQGMGRSLSTQKDVVHQVSHFLYLTTMHSIADPVGEDTVNLDRLRKAYSSFAVGAVSLPETKLIEALMERLKDQLLTNLLDDTRAQDKREELERLIDGFLEDLDNRADQLSVDLVEEGTDAFNKRAIKERNETILKTVEWLLMKVIPLFGFSAVERVRLLLELEADEAQEEIEAARADLRKAQEDLSKAKKREKDNSRFTEWRVGNVRESQDIDREIEELEAKLATLQMLVSDGSANSGPRLLDFARAVVDTLSEQVMQFRDVARSLTGKLMQRSSAALARSAHEPGRWGEGRELRYYDMEVDPSLPGLQDPASLLMKEIVEQDTMRATELLAGDRLYDTLQLLGLTTIREASRLGERQKITSYQQLIDDNGELTTSPVDVWTVERLAETLVRSIVQQSLNEKYSLEALLKKPDRFDGPEHKNMKAALAVSVKGVLNNVRPFWGASPYPDEQQLENIRHIALPFDPRKVAGTPAELFGDYLDSEKSGFKWQPGVNPFRFDALWLQHGAELCHIQEVHDCWNVYSAKSEQEKEGFHLAARYVGLPEPDGIPRDGPRVTPSSTLRWTLHGRARLFERLMVYAGPVEAWGARIDAVLTAADQAGARDLYEEGVALITSEPELGNETFAELHHRFGASF